MTHQGPFDDNLIDSDKYTGFLSFELKTLAKTTFRVNSTCRDFPSEHQSGTFENQGLERENRMIKDKKGKIGERC